MNLQISLIFEPLLSRRRLSLTPPIWVRFAPNFCGDLSWYVTNFGKVLGRIDEPSNFTHFCSFAGKLHCTCTRTKAAIYVHMYQVYIVRMHVRRLHRTCKRTKSTSYVWTYEVYIIRAHVRSTYEVAMAVCGDTEALHKLEDFLRWMLFDNETMSLQFKFIFCFSTLVFSSWIPVSRLAPFSEFALAAFAIGPELLLRPQSKYLRFG